MKQDLIRHFSYYPRAISAFVLATLAFALALVSIRQDAYALPPPKFRVLALLPLSGPEAHQGSTARNGILHALDDPAVSQVVEVVFEDSLGDVVRSTSVYRSTLLGSKPDLIVTIGSPIAMALSPMVNADEILLFAIAAAPAYSSPSDYTYRLISSAEKETEFLVQSIKRSVGQGSLAVVWQESDYGQGTSRAFLKRAELEGLSVGHQESFLPRTQDYRTRLAKIKSKNPRAIYLAFYGEDAGLFVRQAREIGLQGKIFCSQACTNPDFIRSAGGKAEGVLVSTGWDNLPPGVRQAFQRRFGEQMTYVASRNYLVVRALGQAWAKCHAASSRTACLRTFFDEQGGTDGVPRFDPNGDIVTNPVFLTVKGTEFELVG